MAKYKKKGHIEVVKLGIDFTYVTKWGRTMGRDVPKEYTTAPAGSALIIEGEGEDQTIYHMPWADAHQQFEPDEDVAMHDDDALNYPRRAASPRRVAVPPLFYNADLSLEDARTRGDIDEL